MPASHSVVQFLGNHSNQAVTATLVPEHWTERESAFHIVHCTFSHKYLDVQ